MSGIAGIVSAASNVEVAPLLERMSKLLSARGPDRQAVWSAEGAGLVHCLLATTDEAAAGRQPCTLDGRTYITADCRIDGREALWLALEARGRQSVRKAGDAELILHAHAVWGEACVERLIGDFAFAIWDTQSRRLFCARDQSGVKLFYYSELPGQLVFSNTLRCVRLHPEVSGRIDELSLLDFLLLGMHLREEGTIFAGIRALPPAHSLTWQEGRAEIRRYWTRPIDEPVRYRRSRDYVDHFVELLDTAIRDRTRTSRVAIQMSGGLDSTLLAARAAKIGAPVEAHSVYYETLIPDGEKPFAQMAADSLGIPIYFLCGDDYAPYKGYAEIARQLPEPDGTPNYLFALDHRRRMAERNRVSFYGEGPDNLLPYEWKPYLAFLRARGSYGELAGSVAWSFWKQPRIPFAFWRRRRARGGPAFTPPEFPEWIQPAMVERYGLRERWSSFWVRPASGHPYHPKGYHSMSSPNWSSAHTMYDPGVSGVNVETRHPFLDLRLARYLLALPVIPWCRRKLIIREASKDGLPEAIWNREKTPLAGDPLLTHHARGGFNGFVPPPPEVFSKFVRQWPAVSGENGWALLLSTAPIGLNFWWQAQSDIFLD